MKLLLFFLALTLTNGRSELVDQFEACLKESKLDLFKEDDIYLEVLISPLVNALSDAANEIRVIWKYDLFETGDQIVLYKDRTPVFSARVRAEKGHKDTGVFFDSNSNYSAVYRTGNKTVSQSYFTKYPTWMDQLKPQLEDLYVSQAFIPGTHISAAYYSDDKQHGNIYKYLLTQDKEVIDQLISGIRYLDLRVGYYNSTDEKWWSNHDFMPIRPFKIVVDQVKSFLNATNEIVFLDFHRFPIGFNAEVHQKFATYLEGEFRPWIYEGENKCRTKFKDIWKSGKRLLISYNTRNPIRDSFMHPPIEQYWGNKQSSSALYTYLNNVFQTARRRKCWSAMAELTPTAISVILDTYGGLRKMADKVNSNLSWAFHDEWAERANIVAVDFFESTGIISAAIKANIINHCAKKFGKYSI